MELSATHIHDFGSRINHLVNSNQGKVEGHEFNNRSETNHSRANANSGKAKFSNRRIYNALRTKFLQHSFTYFIGAIIFGYLFSHQENILVTKHFFTHGFAKCFAEL